MSPLLFLLNPSMIKTFECVQYKDISDDGSLNTSDLRPNTTLDVSANGSSPMDMDLDCDSPFSPGSASGLSDLFEPPNSSPPPSSLPRLFLTNRCHNYHHHSGLACLGVGPRKRVGQVTRAPGKPSLEVKAVSGSPRIRGSHPGSHKPKMV